MKYLFVLALSVAFSVNAAAQDDKFEKQTVLTDITTGDLTLEESTAAISVITAADIEHRTSKNIGNSILGQGLGLISLQGAGNFADQNPTFFVRGLQTLNSNNSPLILVDGIEREITSISAEEVERVSILKDAAATALYGYKGINGAILLTTKRGEYDTQKVKFSYDHQFNSLINKPQFVDAYTYGLAINEARANDGLAPRYSSDELGAFKSGQYPTLYPNVNWVEETFKNTASTNNFNLEFSGGQGRFRYFAMLNLISDKGFINGSETNDGYSTQDKYVRGNMRMNMDIDLTKTTDLIINVFGMLSEDNRPGSNINAWDLVYTVPSAAFPIKDNLNKWGGSDVWAGTKNPVGQTRGAAYYKNHDRLIFTDVTIKQDLSSWTKGLSAFARVSYDLVSKIYENHSKTYVYNVHTPSWPAQASAPTETVKTYGTDSQMGSGSGVTSYNRRTHFDFGVKYDFATGKSKFNTQFKYDYDYEDVNGANHTVYRHNLSLWGHYSFADKLLADVTLMESGTSRLAPGTKWNFSPTVSLGWLAINGNDGFVNFLKLRASAGILNADYVPGSNVWSYYSDQYSTGGSKYPFSSSYDSDISGTKLGRLATTNPYHETALKTNFGVDARFGGLTLTADGYYQRRSNIWVSSEGKYSTVVGRDTPYENGGIVDSYGAEIGLNYNKTWGDFTLDLGGNFNLNKNKIVEMFEQPRPSDNLIETGKSVDQIFGLKAIGFFKDQADIDNSPTQTFCQVVPGDIKYEDVNKDGKIDENDKIAIGYNTTCPEIFYNFHLGAEWKGLGFYALFQGATNYSAILNTKSMYWPLIDNTNISQYCYDNRWTPSNQNALFPRLSSQSNENNYQTNTLYLTDRSFLKLRNVELYYRLPDKLMEKTKFIKGSKLYVRGNDLFAIDKLAVSDAEAYGTSQLFRSVIVGLSLTF